MSSEFDLGNFLGLAEEAGIDVIQINAESEYVQFRDPETGQFLPAVNIWDAYKTLSP